MKLLAKVNFLSEDTNAQFNRVFKEFKRHNINLKTTSEIGEYTLLVVDGPLDIEIMLALIAIVYTKCEKTINVVRPKKSRGIENWQDAIGDVRTTWGNAYLKNVMIVGDVDKADKYLGLEESLKGYDLTEIKQGEAFELNLDPETRVVVTFNGNVKNSQFDQHEIEEDVHEFLKNTQIENLLKGLALNSVSLTRDPKKAYEDIKNRYENSSEKVKCNKQEIRHLDELVVHSILTNKDIAKKVFDKQVLALEKFLEV